MGFDVNFVAKHYKKPLGVLLIQRGKGKALINGIARRRDMFFAKHMERDMGRTI